MALSSHSRPAAPVPIFTMIFSTLPVPSASVFIRSGLLDCLIQQVDSPFLLTSNASVYKAGVKESIHFLSKAEKYTWTTSASIPFGVDKQPFPKTEN
jgi:hypothetical protein